MTNHTFKPGDEVYYPSLDDKVHVLKTCNCPKFPVCIEFSPEDHECTADPDGRPCGLVSFTVDGRYDSSHNFPSIFHATTENRSKIANFYGSSQDEDEEIHLLYKEKALELPTPFMAFVTDYASEAEEFARSGFYYMVFEGEFAQIRDKRETLGGSKFFVDHSNNDWLYAIPVDAAGKPLPI